MYPRPGQIVYWIGYYFLKGSSKLWFPFSLRGRENIPPVGSCIFASNHLSNLDPLLIGLCLDRPISYMAKDSLFKNRVFGSFLKRVWAFPIKRGTADIGSLKEALKRLKSGSPLVLFPQGTRRKPEDFSCDHLHPGVGFLAAKSGVPVIPVYIDGSDKVLPPGAKWFQRCQITLTMGKPLIFNRSIPNEEIARRIMETIFSLKI